MKSIQVKKVRNHQLFINIILFTGLILMILFLYIYKNDKIAYVDSGKIMDQYKGAIVAKKAYKEKSKSWQSRVDTLTFDFQNSLKSYEKAVAKMSNKERLLSQQLLNSKQKQLVDYQKAMQENIKNEDAKLYGEVVAQINAFLLEYGEKHDYKIILIANQSGTIAYAKQGLDITTDVVDGLNQNTKFN